MASSAAQIHGLGVGSGISSASSRKPSLSFAPRSVFFGQNLRKTPATLLKHTNNTSRRRYSTGPVRIVNEKVVGIDLGTTNLAVAAMEGGKPAIVTNAEGQRTTPSVVAYTKKRGQACGADCEKAGGGEPGEHLLSVKRFIGRKMSEVDEESKQVSYKVVRDENGNVKLECPAIGKQFAAEEISAQVLRKLVDDASKFLNDKVTKAVVTVPAYFNDSQGTSTKDAGRIAGLEVLRIINEPAAASLAYGFERKNNETILVFDLGGGTFDVSVTEEHLGGDDFDKRVVDWLAGNFKRDEGIDLLKDKQALQRLAETAEKAKMELSSLTQTNISLSFITATADGPKHIETTLTRAKFEELCSDLLDRFKTPVENSLRDAKLAFKDLDEVILVGGSTCIPAVQELVKKYTGKDPNVTVNPDEVVALGAAVQAGVLSGDVTPRGVPQIEVKFDIDANGILSVAAIDKGTGKKPDITITGASTLPSDEVERMVSEAEKFSKEDKEKRDAIDTKNQTEKQLKEQGEKVPVPVKEKVEAKLQELKDAVAGGSTQVMKDAMAALNQEVMQLGQSLCNQPGAAPGGEAGDHPIHRARDLMEMSSMQISDSK
ncbi:hypothetical protein OIU84_022858 [Salix udensis]|uniref:Heat shock protein 70 n=1 Tax=Salix udensis TaxID=889485 RepID=A0AAD6PE90_9ROSI|nr:hypothetical protein OIU84_022858 [Salix udensis]